ncbi:anti-sigma regulatory factor (Ser/Thr protein kinase) [Streptomyces sp. KhCrAH-43]|uniref:ATP-binding protein n=1 Tax=unclassified Streptomyces TaxID=2593676 RepID=UPI000362D695|nr:MULTISPECIES: ATP-binding protein [unclassified Streptomyces]MYS33864.1 ATP-binding protein [Streptomyces sp. SID4920]MYX70357.1 ATP-binding protein [Streptomyces sp. SID8373]RAJ60835.1 anti-sigma regulatory factor (Ser/Thr protein kinase) [Streptomyces sp. KhCrAH-43]
MPQATTQARPTGPPGYSQTLPRRPESAAVARRLTEAALCCWGLGELADDGALIVSELVANAVRHARRESVRVLVERISQRKVRVAVTDFSRGLPVECQAGDGDESGRGLLLVAALASDWGTDTRRWGKVVWADLEGHG